MIDASEFSEALKEKGIDFCCGVPDSLLKNLLAYLDDNSNINQYLVTANEGTAIGVAAGHFLSSGSPALVFMQNSGLGNCINPLTSLADKEVYGIPMLLLIGWRGEPGVHDEPQHIKQGRITRDILKALEIPYAVLSNNMENVKNNLHDAFEHFEKHRSPYALIVKKNTFNAYESKANKKQSHPLRREEALTLILNYLSSNDVLVATTGKCSREIYEIRESQESSHQQDFLTVGSMGHASSIALGIAKNKPEQRVVCIDGDGAALMHLGALSTIGKLAPKNLIHILINNYVHDSVGGQATSADVTNFSEIAKATNYASHVTVENQTQLDEVFKDGSLRKPGPHFLEIKIKMGSRSDLGRPSHTPEQAKNQFMGFLREGK